MNYDGSNGWSSAERPLDNGLSAFPNSLFATETHHAQKSSTLRPLSSSASSTRSSKDIVRKMEKEMKSRFGTKKQQYPFKSVSQLGTEIMKASLDTKEKKLSLTMINEKKHKYFIHNAKNKNAVFRKQKLKLNPILHAMPAGIRTRSNITSEQLMNEWLSSYDVEEEKFASLSMELEIKMKRAEIFSRSMEKPSRLKTAVAFECLDQLSDVMGRFRGIFDIIKKQLEESIFVQNEDRNSTNESKFEEKKSNSLKSRSDNSVYMKRKTYFESATELDIEREKVLEFAQNLQQELENWEKHKVDEAENEEKTKTAETAWTHIIKRGKKEKRVARLLHSVATAHAAFRSSAKKTDDDDDIVSMMVEKMKGLNDHEQAEVIELLLRDSSRLMVQDILTHAAIHASGTDICKVVGDVLPSKIVKVSHLQAFLLSTSTILKPRDKRHILTQVLLQCPCGDNEIVRVDVLKKRKSGEKHEKDDEHASWDVSSLQNLLRMISKVEHTERELSEAWDNHPIKVPHVMSDILSKVEDIRKELTLEFNHDSRMNKYYLELKKEADTLDSISKETFKSSNKKNGSMMKIQLVNTRSNLVAAIESLRSLVVHRLNPHTKVHATERVECVNTLMAQLTDLEYNDLLERLNLTDKGESSKAISDTEHLLELINTYHETLKKISLQTITNIENQFEALHELRLVDGNVLPIPEETKPMIYSKGTENDSNKSSEHDEEDDLNKESDDVTDDSLERSKQQSMQQLLLAWLKYLANDDKEKHSYNYSRHNTSSFDVLADGKILSKALWEIIQKLPSDFKHIECTGLGRIHLLPSTGNENSTGGIEQESRRASWNMSKCQAYRSHTEHQLSYTKLMEHVFRCANQALGAPATLWGIEDLRALDPLPMFSILGFLYCTYPSIHMGALKSNTLAIALKRNKEFWEECKPVPDGNGKNLKDAVSELIEISANTKKWVDTLVRGNTKYTKSRSAIMRQIMEEHGRKMQGISTASETNDQKVHQLAMHLDLNNLPPALQDEEEDELRYINNLFSENAAPMYAVYRAYAAMGRTSSGTILAKTQFLTLVKDSLYDGSIQGTFRSADMGTIFDAVIQQKGEPTMDVHEFVHALVLVASRYVKGKSLSNCVEKFMNSVLVKAKKSDIDRFRALLKEAPVVRVIKKYIVTMKKEFKKFTRYQQEQSMTIKDFKKYVTEKGLMGRSISLISNFQLSASILREIFNHVQRSSTVEVEDEFNSDTEEADNDDELMDFKEFTEAWVAIALYTNSSPFVAAEQRIEKLFSQIFKRTRSARSKRPKSASK